jgi:FixJ family two-component response regulator
MRNSKPLIAVVDDEASVRVALQRLIRAAGLDVKTFPSGTELLEYMRARQPDCIVLDLHMPGDNGFEVQSQLALAGMQVPVIVITGHDTTESRSRAMAGGALDYLLKPVDERILLDAISAALGAAPV